MKHKITHTAKTKISSSLKRRIENTIDYHDLYKNSYFFWKPGNCSQREYERTQFDKNNPLYTILVKDGYYIQVEPSLRISSRNYYYKLQIAICKDGVMIESKDVRFLKGILQGGVNYINGVLNKFQ